MAKTDHRTFLKHFLPTAHVLKAYLLAATGDMHAADDLLQEVSSVLWEKLDQYERLACPILTCSPHLAFSTQRPAAIRETYLPPSFRRSYQALINANNGSDWLTHD